MADVNIFENSEDKLLGIININQSRERFNHMAPESEDVYAKSNDSGNDKQPHKQGLTFEIISTRITEGIEEKRYVIYTVQLQYISKSSDVSPSVIERRYTHFLDLYTSLKKEHPNLMNYIVFPKKALTGNFSNELISARSTGFKSLLNHIASKSQLTNSSALLVFLQNVELIKVKELLMIHEYVMAYPILESILKLLNKVLTDRSPAVLLALVRLVACAASIPEFPDVLKWADLALHRYEGVSDGDLLALYVPLLQTCVKLWCQNGRNPEELEKRLSVFQKQGIKVDEKSLLHAVDIVEQKIFSIENSK